MRGVLRARRATKTFNEGIFVILVSVESEALSLDHREGKCGGYNRERAMTEMTATCVAGIAAIRGLRVAVMIKVLRHARSFSLGSVRATNTKTINGRRSDGVGAEHDTKKIQQKYKN